MKKIITYIILAFLAIFCLVYGSSKLVEQKNTIQRLETNLELLLRYNKGLELETKQYKVQDSLNAAKIQSLELSVKEFKEYRAQDLALIKDLSIRAKDLESLINTRLETTDTIAVTIHDTLQGLRTFDYKSKWTDVQGYIDDDTLQMSIQNREELKVIESIKRKRVLGFLWYSRKLESRNVDVISLNPNTEIKNVSYINITQ